MPTTAAKASFKREVAQPTSSVNCREPEVIIPPTCPPVPINIGVVYTRWGNSSCAKTSGANLVYSGMAGKGYYAHPGGGIDFQCMPQNPEYHSNCPPGEGGAAFMYGVEYKNPMAGTDNHNVPCAVCYAPYRASQLMIPAKLTCPVGWVKEYDGYLMSSHYNHSSPSTFLCVDRSQESLVGSSDSAWGGAIYHVQPECDPHGFPCPPYDSARELACVVCTK